MIIAAAAILAYAAFLGFVISILTVAKRADEAMARAAEDGEIRVFAGPTHPRRGPVRWSASVERLPGQEELGRVAGCVLHTLGVEQVCVIAGEHELAESGVVAACVNAPGLLGERLPIEARARSRLLSREEAATLGLTGETPGGASWAFAHVPLHGSAGVRGAVTVAARRMLAFSPRELTLIERLARGGAPRFERRRSVRTVA